LEEAKTKSKVSIKGFIGGVPPTNNGDTPQQLINQDALTSTAAAG
jgi:hypothetical protein